MMGEDGRRGIAVVAEGLKGHGKGKREEQTLGIRNTEAPWSLASAANLQVSRAVCVRGDVNRGDFHRIPEVCASARERKRERESERERERERESERTQCSPVSSLVRKIENRTRDVEWLFSPCM